MSNEGLVLYHHPFSRAATVVWMLEELGRPYTLRFVDLMKGQQKSTEHRALNPMGKVPVLVDGPTVITETSAIGLYLADRYALGRLAPALDAPERGAYLRWSVYPAAVIEPCAMAKGAKWEYRPGQAGFGTYDEMLATVDHAIGAGPWLLGEQFTMADVTFGATLRWMLRFDMIEKRPSFLAYVERISARPASLAADAKNAEVLKAQGIQAPGA
ncbi:glutathione S-transferase family protein [Myxococcota bacterium]|nr:glutathione S-transferase family protein [Myxococcota bacterium]